MTNSYIDIHPQNFTPSLSVENIWWTWMKMRSWGKFDTWKRPCWTEFHALWDSVTSAVAFPQGNLCGWCSSGNDAHLSIFRTLLIDTDWLVLRCFECQLPKTGAYPKFGTSPYIIKYFDEGWTIITVSPWICWMASLQKIPARLPLNGGLIWVNHRKNYTSSSANPGDSHN